MPPTFVKRVQPKVMAEFKVINKTWKAYLLRRQIQAIDTIYNQKISSAPSPEEASRQNKEKVEAIWALASRFTKKKDLF